MANEINAVAGQLFGVPVGQVYTAGKGVVIDNVHKTVRVDETVLWENANGVTGASFPLTLSEAPANFERIRLVLKPWSSRVITSEFPGSETSFLVDSSWCDLSMTSMYNFITIFSVDSTSLTFVGNKFIKWGTTTINSDTSQFSLYKVVGINRISS